MNQSRLKNLTRKPITAACLLALVSTLLVNVASHAEALGPPTLGEKTKGTPAVAEVEVKKASADDASAAETATTDTTTKSVFGSTTVTEHKRESGQRYLIELDNSLSGKQYLYENDSDGQIGSSVEDNDSIGDIPKWKLGSW